MNSNKITVEQSEKEKWALGSLILNIFLTLIKFIFALITGSLSLLAEAIHSFSDLVVSIISLISVKLANKKTEEFPYGLYKIENIASIIISIFLFFTAYEIVKEALFSPKENELKNVELAIFVMVITMILTFFYSRLELRASERLNSPTLKADASHIWADFLSSVIVIVGLVGTYLGFNLDKYTAVIVSLFIVHSGWEIFTSGLKTLLDVSLDKAELEAIKDIIKRFPSVREIKYIRGREAGSFKFLEMEILLNNSSLRNAHKIVDKIADQIKREIPNIDSVFIHYEPVRQYGLKLGILTDDKNTLTDFKSATKIKVIFIDEDFSIKDRYEVSVEGGEKEVAKKSIENNLDMIVSKNHPLDFEVRWDLARAGIIVWETEKESCKEALEEILKSYKELKMKKEE